jgi:dTDP-4-amino-4,6-dideoxygalactose transaminase
MREAILAALDPVLFGGMDSGAIRTRFEHAFAETVEQAYAVAVHSGTIGLFLALRACGVLPGDEVITVGNSDISTTAAIRQAGAIPVLCDISADDFTIDPTKVEQCITKRTRALLPVDLYGHPADVRALRELADQYGLMIVEDAALAAGGRDGGKSVGIYADAAVFSFAPFKPLGSVGNGAVVVTSSAEIDRKLRLASHYGHNPVPDSVPSGHQSYVYEGYNVPLDPLQAALLLTKLPHLDAWTARRQAIAARYAEACAGTTAQIPVFRSGSQPTFRAYTICVPDQAAIYAGLRAAEIEVVLHYTPAVYCHPIYGGSLPGSLNLPITDAVTRSLVCLPVTPELTDDDVDYVTTVLHGLLSHS